MASRLLLLPRTLLPLRQIRHSSFTSHPSPPRLPKEEQEEFERLQRASTGAFSTPQTTSQPQSQTATTTATTATSTSTSDLRAQINQSPETKIADDGLHPNLRRGAKAEFEGDVNPRTGEVGGPKSEPLRWGGSGDWSYNGRVTDF
ncbi:hypothetical protein GQ44DRAFT_700252 [Phaeosphaeriaceae sp. PMI808]|nr:hypothetical protein GQ44DRAFT_700252 [Phaeosphaeriaceae sp. PMI808]